LILTVYCAGGGPAYGGAREKRDELSAVIKAFAKELSKTSNATCEIQFPTDFGLISVGAENGKPFDRMVNE
jgi:hypothetical protein